MPSEDKIYRSLADLISDALVVLQNDHFQIVNSAFTKLFGYTQHDVDEGLSFFKLVQDNDKQAVQRRYEDRLVGKQVLQTFSIDLIAKDDTIKPCETSATVIEYDSRPADLVLIRDISERVHTEAALRKSETEYRELFENMLEGAYKTLPDGTIIKANPALVEMLGYESEEELCTSVKVSNLYLNPDNRLDLIRTLEKEGELRNVEIELRCKDDRKITVLENSRVVRDASGKVSHYEGILTDITERKGTVEALIESETRYRTLFDGSAQGILVADLETKRFKYANSAICRMLGYTEEEMTLLTVMDIHPMESLEHTISEFEAQARGEKLLAPEIPCLRKNGKIVYTDISTTKVTFDGRECNLGFFTDITERRGAVEALAMERDRVQKYLNVASTIMIALNRNGEITLINQKGCRILGYKEQEILGKNWFDTFLSKDIVADVKDVFRRLLDGKLEPVEYFENNVVTASGDLITVAWHNSMVRDESGTIVGSFSSGEDITERKQAEEALRESEEKLRNIVEHSTNLFYSHTPEHELTYLSPQSRDILQCDPDEAMIRWTEFATDNLANERGFALTEKAIKTGKRQPSYELELVGKKGRIVWVEVHEAPIVEKGKTVAVVGSLTDITEHKLSVEKLKETTESLVIERQELTEKNIALKQILEHIERKTQSHRQQVCLDIEKAIMPAVTRLKKKAGPEFADQFEDLETAIAVVLSKDIEEHVARYSKLTSRESEICEMIKASMSSKQIADSLNLSLPTVLKHREHARKKLGITGKNLSLSTYLRYH